MRRLLAVAAAASAYDLDWNDQFSASDKTLALPASETLSFAWAGYHDVVRMADEAAYDACDFAGSTSVGSATGVSVTGASGDVDYYARSAVWTSPVRCSSTCVARQPLLSCSDS